MTTRNNRMRSQSSRSVKSTKSTKSQTKSMASSFKNAYNDIKTHGFGMYSMNKFLTSISETDQQCFYDCFITYTSKTLIQCND
jgi:hypothetical protein